jgi:Transcriptional regulator, AbiEi antitoxin
MRAESFSRSDDRVIAELARRQHGVVARRQLIQEGLSEAAIGRRLKAGRLHQLHRGVYLVGHAVPAQYAPGDLRRRHGLPLTSPPRTILDLAAVIDGDELEPVVAEAHYRRLASEAELRQQLERNPHGRGVVSLRTVLGRPAGPRRTRSEGERALLRLLRERGIGGFETNAKVHGYEVDFSLARPQPRGRGRRLRRPLGARRVRARPNQGRNPQSQRDRRDADHGPPNQS